MGNMLGNASSMPMAAVQCIGCTVFLWQTKATALVPSTALSTLALHAVHQVCIIGAFAQVSLQVCEGFGQSLLPPQRT
jgi:hypothetical protein